MIDLEGKTLVIADGAGRECWFTDQKPPKMPKTRHQQDKAVARKDRVGGKKCRTARLKKKRRAARIRGAYLAGSILEGNITWEETGTTYQKCALCDEPINVELILGGS